LTIVQDVQGRIGLPRSTAVMSATDQTTRSLLALSIQEGKELARYGNWQALTKEKTFTTVAAETQTDAIPTDFGFILDDTVFNRTTVRKLEGPLSAQQWQDLKALPSQPVFPQFRIRGNSFLYLPTPSAGDTIAYEYVSKYWVDTDADGIGNAVTWAADANTSVLDEELITLGVIWRFKKARGLDYSEEFRTYDIERRKALTRDGGKPKLNAAGPGIVGSGQQALRSAAGVIW